MSAGDVVIVTEGSNEGAGLARAVMEALDGLQSQPAWSGGPGGSAGRHYDDDEDAEFTPIVRLYDEDERKN